MLKPCICIICYQTSNGDVQHSDARETLTLKRFFLLLERHLGGADHGDELPVPLFEKFINAGMKSCEECSKAVHSFCELSDQMKSIEIKLNTKLMKLQGILSCAEMNSVRKKEFENCVKGLADFGDDASVEESLGSMFSFKGDLIIKCGRKLQNTLDDLCQPRRNIQHLNYSRPLILTVDEDVASTGSKIIKLESLEINEVENSDASQSRNLSSQDDQDYNDVQNGQDTGEEEGFTNLEGRSGAKDLQEDNVTSRSQYEILDTNSNSKCDEEAGGNQTECAKTPVVAPPAPETNSDEELEDPMPILSVRMLPPMVCNLPRGSTEEQGTPYSNIDPDPETGKFKCSSCSKEFHNKANVRRHYNIVHLKIRYKCTLCHQQFTRRGHYTVHYQKLHTPTPRGSLKYKCPSEFEDAKGGPLHYKKPHQTQTHILKCQVCPKIFSSKNNLNRHHRSIHMGVKFKCSRCNKHFSQKDNLNRHKRRNCCQPKTRPSSRKALCAQYKTTFRGKGNLQTHPKSNKLQMRDRVYPACGKKFSRNSQLQEHLKKVHNKFLDHVCKQCGKRFGDSRDLQRHGHRVHLQPQQEYTCQVCSKEFATYDYLGKHLKTAHHVDEVEELDTAHCRTLSSQDEQVKEPQNIAHETGDVPMTETGGKSGEEDVQKDNDTSGSDQKAGDNVIDCAETSAPALSENNGDEDLESEMPILAVQIPPKVVCKLDDVTSTGSKVIEVEPLEINQGENPDTSDSRALPSQDKQDYKEHQLLQETGEVAELGSFTDLEQRSEDEDSQDDNDTSGSEYEMPDTNSDSESDEETPAESPLESDPDEELEGKMPILSVDIPSPVVCTLPGESTEDEGTPPSIVNPETGKIKCRICLKEFHNKTNVRRHYKIVHLKIRYKCTLCHQQFTRRDHYTVHYRKLHSGRGNLKPKIRKHKCRVCQREFDDPMAALHHCKQVRQNPVHKCLVCQKRFSSRKVLLRHHRSIHIGETFQCPRCNKHFSRKDNLNFHQRHICGQPVRKRSSKKLISYKTKNSQIRDRVCNKCGKRFSRYSQLLQHLRKVHWKLRKHVCNKCGKGYGNSRNLQRHVKGETCSKVHSTSDDLSSHLKTAHGDSSAEDLECTECGKRFDLGCELNAHRRNMHTEYPDPEVCESETCEPLSFEN